MAYNLKIVTLFVPMYLYSNPFYCIEILQTDREIVCANDDIKSCILKEKQKSYKILIYLLMILIQNQALHRTLLPVSQQRIRLSQNSYVSCLPVT